MVPCTKVFNHILRIDTIVSDVDNQPYLLEINSIPGMTAVSAFPRMIEAIGWDLPRFYDELIETALQRKIPEQPTK